MDSSMEMDLPSLASPSMLAPELGIISRTLSSSSTFKWILPARIRSPSKNDIVFIGDSSIQLREFMTEGPPHLTDAISKLDLHTQILAANVISAKLEPIPVLEATLNQSGDDERFTIKGRPIEDGQPAQFLILSTASCHLIFVYAKQLYDGSVRLVSAKRALIGGLTSAQKLGRHLAVDHESRAIAVAPAIGHFSVLSLHPVDEIKGDIDNWRPRDPSSFRPFYEHRILQVDGTVLKMDFLHSPRDEKEKVILALIVANKGEMYLLLWRWDTRGPLHRIKPMRCSGQSVPSADGFPLMLIPCVSSFSFLLVTEAGLMVVYDQVFASEAHTTRYSLRASDIAPSGAPGQLKRWTQWARPKRHLQHRLQHDDIFIIREDGVVETCLIDFTSRKVKVTTSVTPGRLNICVDTAFCLLAGPAHTGGGDIIIAGGDMTDGGVFQARARQPMERIQALPNCSPVQDLILLKTKDQQPSGNGQVTNTHNIFACCGHMKRQGSVALYNYGFEACIGWSADYPDIKSIGQLWTFEITSQESLLLLSSHPSHTSMLMMDLRNTDLEYADESTYPGLDFYQATLAAALLQNDLLAQITTRSLNLQHLTEQTKTLSLDIQYLRTLCAVILSESALIAIAHTSGNSYGLSLCKLDTAADSTDAAFDIRPAGQMRSRPLCMSSFLLNGMVFVLTGTENGDVYIHGVNPALGARETLCFNVDELVRNLDGRAVGSICLLTKPMSLCGLMLCGLRGGHVVCIEINMQHHNGQLVLVHKLAGAYKLGESSCTVVPDNYSESTGTVCAAFAVCQSVIKKIDLIGESMVSFNIADVFITTHNDNSRPQPICNAVHRIRRLQSRDGREPSGFLIGVTADDLFFSSLSSQQQAILRHFPVPGVPKRIIHLSRPKQLVIALESSIRGDDQPEETSAKLPQLCFVPVNIADAERSTAASGQRVVIGDPGEQIKAMVEYNPTDGKNHYAMIVVGLMKEVKESNGMSKPMSRVVCLNVQNILKSNATKAGVKNVMSFSGKTITALCPTGKSGLLIAAGEEVILHSLDVGTKRWDLLSKHPLPSLATSIDVQGSFVFIACVKHSLLILHEDNKKLKFYGADSVCQITNNVLTFDRYKAVITSMSDKGTNLIGFSEDRLSNSYTRLFDANVPLMVDRLRAESSQDGRHAFIGSTTDGTLYRFTTIKREEWALLSFIQSLWLQEKELPPSTRRTSHGLTAPGHEPHAAIPSPESMHINGDMLSSMLEPGPASLRGLLEEHIKVEDEIGGKDEAKAKLQRLEQLAEPVTGSGDDVLHTVSIWVRKLLQWPQV